MKLKKSRENQEKTIKSVYLFICDYVDENGVSPSQREISEGCFVSQPCVIRYLDILEARELISRFPGIPRSIRVEKRLENKED